MPGPYVRLDRRSRAPSGGPACRAQPEAGPGLPALTSRAAAENYTAPLNTVNKEESIAPLWRLLDGLAEDDWHNAIEMENAQVAVAGYFPDWWPADTRLLIRRVLLDPARVSADPRSRRRRTLHPVQRALPLPELASASPRSTATRSS